MTAADLLCFSGLDLCDVVYRSVVLIMALDIVS